MMSANCSVVVTLFRVSRPCRTQCCTAKCLMSTCFNRPGPKRVAMPMHADASSFRQAVTSSHGVSQLSLKFASPQELTRTHSCRVKFIFTTAQRCWCLRASSTSHARSSKHQQTTSGRPPFFRRGLPTSHHNSQPLPSTVHEAESIPDGMSRVP